MKISDLFTSIDICYPAKINEAKRDSRGNQKNNKRGQPVNAAGNASGVGMGRSNTRTTTNRSVGTERTSNQDARDSQNTGTNSRLAQVDSIACKCQIEVSEYFESSVIEISKSLGINQDELNNRIDQFIKFKIDNGCNVAFLSYGEDKPSGLNLKGEIIRPYQDDNHWHCHLSISKQGDPMIAYRLLSGSIRLVCITTHKLCFSGRSDSSTFR